MVLAILSSVTELSVLNLNCSDKSRFRSAGYIPSQIGQSTERWMLIENFHEQMLIVLLQTVWSVGRDRAFFRLIYSQTEILLRTETGFPGNILIFLVLLCKLNVQFTLI